MKKEHRTLLESSVNPFTVIDFIPTREISITNKLINLDDLTDGIVTRKPAELKTNVTVDNDEYTRLFTRTGLKLHVLSLTDNAKALFLWLMFKIDYSEDFVELKTRQLEFDLGRRNDSIRKAIDELVSAGIIALTNIKNVYWINPLFFFKGSRIKKYPNSQI